MKVSDLIYYMKLMEAPEFFKVFEAQLDSQLKLIRSKSIPRYVREWWIDESKRTLRYALFLRYYAAFESQLKLQCETFTREEGYPLRLKDLSGDSLLDKVDTYLAKVAGRPPLREHRLWEDLLSYMWVRNRIIHDDGQVWDVKNIPKFIARFLKRRRTGLSITSKGVVRLNRPFCPRAARCMARVLYDVYGSFPQIENVEGQDQSEEAEGVEPSASEQSCR